MCLLQFPAGSCPKMSPQYLMSGRDRAKAQNTTGKTRLHIVSILSLRLKSYTDSNYKASMSKSWLPGGTCHANCDG